MKIVSAIPSRPNRAEGSRSSASVEFGKNRSDQKYTGVWFPVAMIDASDSCIGACARKAVRASSVHKLAPPRFQVRSTSATVMISTTPSTK